MADEQLKQQIDEYVDAVWEDLINDMGRLVAIESVENLDEAKPGEPWGHAPALALQTACDIAAENGLEAHNCDGYIGFADVPGESDKYVATIAHVDIVPLGTGWTVDPLKVTRKDGYLLGRGVIDDKGPWTLSLYACKFFADRVKATGKKLPYTLRCMIGCNEETMMHDVHWYLENYPQPAFLFTPDADFPLCYGEKGTYWGHFVSDDLGEDRVIVDFAGGTVPNAIPNLASVTVRADASALPTPVAPEGASIELEDLGDGLAKITAHGIGGHASKPEGTINAILLLVNYLLDNDLCGAGERSFLEMERQFLSTTDGSGIGVASTDDYFDPTTCIGGVIATEGNRFTQTVDCRYVSTMSDETITANATALAAAHGGTFEVDDVAVPFVTDPTSAPIQSLIATYNEMTGKNAEPFTMGGGTYARHFERAASFGPNDPEVVNPDWVHGEHSADEGISEQQLKDSLKIYILAIDRLMGLDL